MKIFGIGLTRTGTTSLRAAMKIFGIPLVNIGNLDCMEGAFIGDRMVIPNDRYKDIYCRYPKEKYILTIRESSDIWFNSVCSRAELTRFNKGIVKQREFMYGYGMPRKHEKHFKGLYNSHIKHVLDFFKEKDNLLVFCSGVDGWIELCSFLGIDIPTVKFPHKNKSK